jgi:hypothetical protein
MAQETIERGGRPSACWGELTLSDTVDDLMAALKRSLAQEAPASTRLGAAQKSPRQNPIGASNPAVLNAGAHGVGITMTTAR